MVLRTFLMIAVLLLSAPIATASNPHLLSGNPYVLLERSLKTSSAVERSIIRGHLAKNYPSTAEGTFSAAWIAGIEGREEDSIALYRRAIDADPEMTVGYINLALALERGGKHSEALGVYDTALNTAPFDVDLVRNGFFLRKKIHGNTQEAMRFLDEWQGKVGNLEYAFDFVRALDAEIEGEHSEAERLYRSAIDKDAPFLVYERLANLRLKQMDPQTPAARRIAYVAEVLEPLLQSGKSDEAYLFIGRTLRDRLNAGRYAIDYFSRAFDINPSAEAASEAFTQIAVHDFNAAREFLEKADKHLPDNYSLKIDLAWMHYQFLTDPDRAGKLALQALELAPHDMARAEAIRTFGVSRQSYGRFDEAHRFYVEKLKQSWPTLVRHKIIKAAAENSIAAQNFSDAKIYLDVLDIQGGESSAWVKNKLALVRQAVELEKVSGTSDRLAPVSPSIHFATDSAAIPEQGFRDLDQLANALKTSGGSKVLSIEGYTDSTGTPAGNDPLSYRRANAVREYLMDKHQIPSDNLRIAAHGSRFPEATNRSRDGRKQNRRVEIWRVGKAQPPRPAALKGNVFSPDGRHAVLERSPPQIWDMRTNTGLAPLYRGGSFRFSPDARYVAATSSYTEEDGHTANAVYVYEAASGRALAQIHEPLEVVGFAWRPDSGALAFATGDGFLKVYDIQTGTFKVTRMGTTRIGGPLVWLADGKRIAGGQHRGTEVVIWDAETLAPVHRLTGVNWPHTLGVSPDGRHLLAFDNRMKLSVWDTRRFSGPRQMDVPMIPLDLKFHPDRPWVVFNAKFEASDVSVTVVDYKRMTEVSKWVSGGTFVLDLSRDGETVTAISRGTEIELPTRTLLVPERN
ncbi:MAG: OmpA family protein [Rhizobiaceae bacterium]|nr:OmpA family protein [Rhizobiaceae bacterium]